MIKFSIVIPVSGGEKYTCDCINSIKKHTTDYEIIIVDNGSKTPCQGPGKVIRNDRNLGFPKAVNQGIKEARGEIVVILNNDTIVTDNWLEILAEHLKTYDMVGPRSNNVSGPQQIGWTAGISERDIHDVARNIASNKKGEILPYHRLVFFCVAMKREVIKKIGLLDEQFSPGNFEDDDYCLRAIQAGFKLGIAQDCFIYHVGRISHDKLGLDYKELLDRNRAKFLAKWPKEKYWPLVAKAKTNCQVPIKKKIESLALVVIAKDEEQGLEQCINSCRDFVDEVVVAVDNSSTDRTLAIARKHASVVKHFDFKDDFSEARNFAHEGVKSDWVLFLDGHEYIKSAPALSKALKIKADGLLCTVEMDNGMRFRSIRIYRRGQKFAGKVHEEIQCQKVAPYFSFVVKHDRLRSQKRGAIAERAKQRNVLVPRLMREEYEKNKRNARALLHLGMYSQSIGNFKEAIKWYKKNLRYSQKPGSRWWVCFNISLCYLQQNKYFRAFWYANRAEFNLAHCWEIEKLKGQIYFQAGKYEKALDSLVASFHDNTADQPFKPWPKDNASTFNLMGECFFRLGFLDKASMSFSRAAELAINPISRCFYSKRAKLMLEMLRGSTQNVLN